MSASTGRILTSFSLAAGLLLACGSSAQRVPVTGTARPQPGVANMQAVADRDVVTRLAGARCAREDRCDNIGPGGRYVSQDNCMDTLRGSMGRDLNAYFCPRGLDRDGVARCAWAIEHEHCGNPFATLSRETKCREGALCIK